jgi:multicomponent Na+:H+ antiporter subunit D
MIASVPPFVIFAVGALLLPLIEDRWRSAWTLLVPLIGLINLLMLGHGTYWQVDLFDLTLTFGRVDKLAFLFALLFHIAAILGSIYALHVRDTSQQVSAMLYAGAALGAVFAGDLLTLFIFWEVMAVSSVFLIWARRTERANQAGMRYLIAQIASGVILLAGTMIHYGETGSLAFDTLGLDGLGGKLIFLAFGIKCAWPFLHTWLTDAYPEATPSGTVFLSAFTTKVAVYVLLRFLFTVFNAEFAFGVIPLGTILMTLAIIAMFVASGVAIFQENIKRMLAYSSIAQIGYMILGISFATVTGLTAGILHMFNHATMKGGMFLALGCIFYRIGSVKLADMAGIAREMPWTMAAFVTGGLGLIGVPLTVGFISKWYLVLGAMENGGWPLAGLIVLSSLLAVIYVWRVVEVAYFTAPPAGRDPVSEAPLSMLIPTWVLIGASVYFGVHTSLTVGVARKAALALVGGG